MSDPAMMPANGTSAQAYHVPGEGATTDPMHRDLVSMRAACAAGISHTGFRTPLAVQVFYVADGSGGFIEIVDAGAGAGVCTVASMTAETICHMLVPAGHSACDPKSGSELEQAQGPLHRESADGQLLHRLATVDCSSTARAKLGSNLFCTGGAPKEALAGCAL